MRQSPPLLPTKQQGWLWKKGFFDGAIRFTSQHDADHQFLRGRWRLKQAAVEPIVVYASLSSKTLADSVE
jgi:hypothetical protein